MKQHALNNINVSEKTRADTLEMKSKLYLQIILLINYMMEENLFLDVE